MSRSAVVILTDPASCGLGSVDLLMQAVLQVQQLNQAGLAASQAFCDHPAAAMKFIEAYTKAYPELHLQASGLPPPEHLYSMVADGRALQLAASAGAGTEMRSQAAQLTPLYVLSLGAPDTLIQSLQQNSLVTGDIQVVDIPTIDRTTTEMGSVADAVAHESLDRSSRRDQQVAESDYSLEGFSPSEQLSSSDTLASISADMDDMMEHRPHGQKLLEERQALNESGTAMQPVTGVGHGGDGLMTGGYSASTSDTMMHHSAAAVPDVGTMPVAPAGTAESLSAAAASAPPDLRLGAPAVGEAESANIPAPPPGTTAEPHQGASNGVQEPNESTAISVKGESGVADDRTDDDRSPASAAPDQTDPAPGDGNDADAECCEKAPDSPQQPDDVVAIADEVDSRAEDGLEDDDAGRQPAPEQEVGPKEATELGIAVAPEEPGRTEGSSFSDPGQDVQYPPIGSFDTDDDNVAYPLPPGGCDVDLFGGLFDASGSCEVVDVAAVLTELSGLSEYASALTATRPDIESEFIEARDGGNASVYGIVGSSLEQVAAAPPDPEPAESHHDEGHDQSMPVIHDIDI